MSPPYDPFQDGGDTYGTNVIHIFGVSVELTFLFVHYQFNIIPASMKIYFFCILLLVVWILYQDPTVDNG